MKKAFPTLFLLSLVPAAFASELLVPSQYPTIQYAIDAADNGDTVIVGLYESVGNINFRGKAITVRSSDPNNWAAVKNTIIDGGGSGSCVVFDTGEGSNSVLEGFTLVDGAGTYVDYSYYDGRTTGYAGGGIFCLNSSPTIRRCNIAGNGLREQSGRPPGRGGGGGSTVGAIHCGGGIALIGNCRATIKDCFVTNNRADYGPGIMVRSYTPEQAASTISNCTVADNYSDLEVSAYEIDCWDTKPLIYNTIVWGGNRRSLFMADPSLVTYCCLREAYVFEGDYDELADPCDLAGAGGNISQSPMFMRSAGDSGEADYHLLSSSPCINAGDPDFADSTELDIDGQSRVMAGRVDIGADEVVSEIIVTKPSGGDVWTSGSTHEIQWSGPRGVAVDILLSTNGGADWQTIAEGLLDAAGLRCALPDAADSDNCLVSVVPSIPDASVVCTEGGVFTIRPYSPGPVVESRWKSLGGDFGRAGLSDSSGPELGCLKWEFETGGAVSASVTIGPDDCVYVPCEDGKLYALDPSGSPLWSHDANSPLTSSPTIGLDGTVYVGGQNGKLHAVDVNGGLRWTHSTKSPISSSPAVSDSSNVYVASQDGVLHALAQDGSELWSFETKGAGEVPRGSIFASPAIGTDGTVYIAGLYDPNLYALDPEDGSLKWACNFESPIYPDYP
ncbi:MAG: PQQ-binding-like beta-propeller repeat protein, partial [Phycisphaerales bacterium]